MISKAENIEKILAPGTTDRRRNPRYEFAAEVEVVDTEAGMAVRGRTADLSHGGCYVDTMNPLPPNTLVKLRLRKWDQSFEAQAKVVYSATGLGMGLMFVGVDPKQQWTVDSWIKELGRQQPC